MYKIFTRLLTFFIALTLTGIVAYVSVTGLVKLFAGGTLAFVLFCIIEISKVALTTALHAFSKRLKWFHKVGIITIIVCMMGLTSLGIYGFLTASYKDNFIKSDNTNSQIELLEKKRSGYDEQLTIVNKEKESVTITIKELSEGLSNNVIQYKDRETGEIITTTSSATRRVLERQLDKAIERQETLNEKSENLSEKVFEIENQIMETKLGDEASAELGSLKFIADATGRSMDEVVKWLTLLIVLLADPVAVMMIIVFNRSLTEKKEKPKKDGWVKRLKNRFNKKEVEVEPFTVDREHIEENTEQLDIDEINHAIAEAVEQDSEDTWLVTYPQILEEPVPDYVKEIADKFKRKKGETNFKPEWDKPDWEPVEPVRPQNPHVYHSLLEEVNPEDEVKVPTKTEVVIEEENPQDEIFVFKKEIDNWSVPDEILEEDNPENEINDEKVVSLWDLVGDKQDKLEKSVEDVMEEKKEEENNNNTSKTWQRAVNNRRRGGGYMGISRV